MALSIDGTATDQFSAVNSSTVTLSTTQTNDIIIIYIGYEIDATSGAPAVSSVSDTASLTWHRRGGTTGATTRSGGDKSSVIDTWWAHAAAVLTNDIITVTLGAVIDDGCLIAFGISGVPSANYNAPWDTNAALPATGTSNVAAGTFLAISGVSTTSNSGFLLCFTGWCVNVVGATWNTGWTAIGSIYNHGAINSWSADAGESAYSAALSGATENPAKWVGGGQVMMYYLDAISAVVITQAVYPPFDVESVDHLRRNVEVISY